MKTTLATPAAPQAPLAVRTFNWRLLFLLWGLLLVALIAFVPYQLTIAAVMQSVRPRQG
jgi:hypothetical protein